MNRTNSLRIACFAALAFLAAACGGAESDTTAGVASAADLAAVDEALALTQDDSNDTAAVDTAEAAATDVELTAEEAGLALAECMRNNGFDTFPDPELDANGGLNLRGALADGGLDFADPNFQTQVQACAAEVGADNLGGGANNRADIQAGIQESLLVYTECLREQGLDVGDLDFGGGAGGAAGNGAGGGDGQARGNGGPGGGGGGSARIAGALGLDIDDPATAEALVACEDILADAFAGAGGNGPGAAPADNTDT